MRIHTLLRHSGGATAVEFAFTAPLFMALTLGIIETGLALWTQAGMENAVEAAARCASVNSATCSSASTIAAYATHNTLGVAIPVGAFTVSKLRCGNQVAGSYDYLYLTNYFHGAKVTLTARSCFPDINAG